MAQLFEFIGNHPLAVGLFAALLALFIRNETRRGGDSVSAQQLVDLVNRENAVVVDVRDANEFKSGHVVDAVNVPFASLEGRLGELEPYRARPIVIADKMGQHGNAAGMVLRKNGFEQVSRLTGGMMEWTNQNLPLVKS
ncbi:MAG: rhodanese-like domain-containing protein [Pseudomonadota bacterium]